MPSGLFSVLLCWSLIDLMPAVHQVLHNEDARVEQYDCLNQSYCPHWYACSDAPLRTEFECKTLAISSKARYRYIAYRSIWNYLVLL